MVRAKKRTTSKTKVKRKSLHPKDTEKYYSNYKEKPKRDRRDDSSFYDAPKREKKPVLIKEKPSKPVPDRLPYYKDVQPQYRPAQQPVRPQSSGGGGAIVAFIITFIIVFGLLWVFVINGDGGGGGGCPTTCNGPAIIIAAQCSCPPDSYYHSTISSDREFGSKQCVCT